MNYIWEFVGVENKHITYDIPAVGKLEQISDIAIATKVLNTDTISHPYNNIKMLGRWRDKNNSNATKNTVARNAGMTLLDS